MKIEATKQIVLNRADVVASLQETIVSIAEDIGFYNQNGTFVHDGSKVKTKIKNYSAGRLEELMGYMETFDLMLSKTHFNLYKNLVDLLK